MTVKEFIGFMNPERVLSGDILFKVILQSSKSHKYGDKWFFYHDAQETPEEDTVEKFCANSGISGCMDFEIDEQSMECIPDYEEGKIYYHFEVYDPADFVFNEGVA